MTSVSLPLDPTANATTLLCDQCEQTAHGRVFRPGPAP
jgi:hypothetical protein